MFNIHLLPAAYGDSILIEYGEEVSHYILIDGGPYYNFDELVDGLRRVAPNLEELELLVITHIDIDHIDGIVTLLNKPDIPIKVKDIWFNGFEQLEEVSSDLGALQGEYITALINDKELPHNLGFGGKPVMVVDYDNLPQIEINGGMVLTLLSPGKTALQKLEVKWKEEIEEYGVNPDFAYKLAEDTRYDSDAWLGTETIEELQEEEVVPDRSAPNGSSIAFIASYDSKHCLFAGDATSDYLLKAIDPLLEQSGEERYYLDAWKLSHHGSKKSNLEKLMKKIDCKKLLISSNGAKYAHPDEACIAKMLKHGTGDIEFYFNYRTTHNKRWADENLQEQYGFKSFYPDDESLPGITIEL